VAGESHPLVGTPFEVAEDANPQREIPPDIGANPLTALITGDKVEQPRRHFRLDGAVEEVQAESPHHPRCLLAVESGGIFETEPTEVVPRSGNPSHPPGRGVVAEDMFGGEIRTNELFIVARRRDETDDRAFFE
jgi:hypothetical protein